MTWFVNGMEILPTQNHQMEYEKTKAVLAIHDTNAKDSGEYTCMAENDLGMQTSSFYLYVKENQNEPTFSTTLTQARSTVGGGAILKCAVAILPSDPEVCWYKDGKVLD